jgi:hypothetical protein
VCTAFPWGHVNAKGCSGKWASACGSHGRLLPTLTRQRRLHIKKLRRLGRDERVDLWSLDECHFQQHGTRCLMWVPPEETDPVLLHAPTRKSVALFGAVNLRNGQFITQFSPKFDAVTFGDFLRKLIAHRHSGRRIVAILDNARYHHATLLQPFLAVHRRKLSLSFLPPYSPDLNPVERVWKLARRLCTHNRYFPALQDLVAAVSIQMDSWKRPNNALYKLCGII